MWKDSESNIDYIDFEYIADLVNEIVLMIIFFPLVLVFMVIGEVVNQALCQLVKNLFEEEMEIY